MRTSPPLVTVGMTAFNAEKTIGLAIASIIAQTFTDWEMLIVDDGSSDATVRIARSFHDERLRLHGDGTRKGVPRRRNEILSMAHGKYLAWMDSDDVSYPQRLEREVAFLESQPDVDLVGADMIVFRSECIPVGKRTTPPDHKAIIRNPYRGFPMSQPTFLGRLSWFREHRYNERATRPDDQDLLLRSYRDSTFAGLPEILVGYREERIDLRKSFRGRRQWLDAIARDAWRHSMLPAALVAGAAHIAKGATELFAVTTGLNYMLLRHRAMPINDVERDDWERVMNVVRAVEAAR
jgi:glycosyltransferase involved in cell wall biosynthesis